MNSSSDNTPKQSRIVLLGPAYPYRGGNSLFMSHLYEALAPHFDVHFINYSLLYPGLLFPGTTQYDQSQTIIKHIPNERLLSSVNPLSWLRVARRIAALRPDAVVFDWWNPFFGPCHYAVCSLLPAEIRKKIVFITENVISHEARAVDRILTRIGLHHAHAFLTLSGQVADDVKPFATKAQPVYRSELPIFGSFYAQSETSLEDAQAHKIALGFAPDDDVLLFFGYVRKYKGLDILLRAMPHILRNNPRTKLLVAGEFYDDPKQYETLIDSLDIRQHVKVVNRFIPNEDVGTFYAACDVVVMPYRSATQSGIMAIAAGFGCPVIITDVGGLAELVEEGRTGFVVPPESPEALARAVAKFYTVRSQVNFSANVRAKAAQNSFSNIPDVFRTIIAQLPA